MQYWLVSIALLFAGMIHAQVPGSIRNAAVPSVNPLNPNGDGFITSTHAAFSSPSDESQFELPFIALQQYEYEPASDNQYAAGCQFYELVNDAASGADAGYYYYNNPDGIPDNGDELVVFRFRVARYSNGSTAFSFLLDTDYRFGFSGPEADPNAVTGNPGFEKEIAVFNSTGAAGGVRVFNVDGTASATIVDFYAPITSHYQVAYALNNDAGCSSDRPVFVDMYVPFAALGIPATRQVRMAVAVNEAIASSLGGGASDIGGINGNLLPKDDDQFIKLITNIAPVGFAQPSNQAPRATDASVALGENSPAGTVVHTVVANDANGDPLTYSITSGNAFNTFVINPTSGVIQVNDPTALNFETTPSFKLVIAVSDGRLYDNAIITVQISNINEPPSLADATIYVDENRGSGALAHTLMGTDNDPGTTLTYSIVSGNSANIFSINPATGELKINGTLDYESINSFTLVCRVTDGFLTDDATITILVNDVNETPIVTDGSKELDEHTSADMLVMTVLATDPDAGSALQFSIVAGNTGAAFKIDASTGQLKVNDPQSLDFEVTPSFTIKVQVSDGMLFDVATITIGLININEAPSLGDATIYFDENKASGVLLHTLTGADPDAGTTLTYSIVSGNNANSFSINPSTGELKTNGTLDYESMNFFTLVCRVTDGLLSDHASVIIHVNDVNETPIAMDGSIELDEHTTAGVWVTTVTASDPDAGSLLQFSIVDGNTGSAFKVDASTGQLTVNDPQSLDFEVTPSFTLKIRVSDGILFDDALITIRLVNVNEPPTIEDAIIYIDENASKNVAVFTMLASDPDSGTPLNFIITSGNELSIFSINGAGQIRLASEELDFEFQNTFYLKIEVSDGFYVDDALLTIHINDLNEPPSVESASVQVSENMQAGSIVHTVIAEDPDAGTILQYSIVQGNSSQAFVIDAQTGTITVNRPTSLDFETAHTFQLTVRATDGILFSQALVVIVLFDVNEAPSVESATVDLQQALRDQEVVHIVRASDPDAADILTFSIDNALANPLYAMDPVSGEIRITEVPRPRVKAMTSDLLVTVKDESGLSASAVIQVNLLPIRERSNIHPLKGFSPNGDGQNDFWFIEGIEAFPKNVITVFNRWGKKVYEVSGYNNAERSWAGEASGQGLENTYFYIIEVPEFEPLTGYVICKPW